MTKKVLITGCGGLVGREACEFFISKGYEVIGIDNNMREYFFGEDGSVKKNIKALYLYKAGFRYYEVDIRNYTALENIFSSHNSDIVAVIHAAAQPSHDWAAKEVFTDFQVNSLATINLLELTRIYSPKACFIFTSTNKVYGDNPNNLPLIERETRYELPEYHELYNGISEFFSTDQTKHSLFGCSKLSADVYVQEYGRYYGLKTTVFRGGCLTGSKHRGAELHGFLNYLVKCNIENRTYYIRGYKGKQVRDNIHSSDLVSAFYEVVKNPKTAEVYNIGGGRHSNCSIVEAIDMIEKYTNKKMNLEYLEENRIGDHIWWISDVSKFKSHYPDWNFKYGIDDIIKEIVDNYE